MTDQQLKEATTVGKESRLFRTIVAMDAEGDDKKQTYEVYKDIWRHTQNKTDVNRNMVATIYAQNPKKFKTNNEDVQKLMKNGISWPK